MKFYLAMGAWFVLGCGSASPTATKHTAVVIPKAPTVAALESETAPIESETESESAGKPRLQIVIGDETACLRVDASLRCWARSTGAQVANLMALAPIAGLGDVSDVAVGAHHVCALVEGGKVFCWGDNAQGQLGARRTEQRWDTPIQAEGIKGAVAITAGNWHSCVLLGDGRVSCWGWNADGQTGSDVEYTRDARVLVVPEVVVGISGATSLAAGRDQTCAKLKVGWSCWGQSFLKSQSDARGNHHNVPAKVDELDDMLQISLNHETACGLFKDGHVGCWGSGAFSILPSRPMRAESPLPVILPVARSFAAGQYHGCAILKNGRVSCWGWNNHGESGRIPQSDYRPHESAVVEGLPSGVESLSLGAASSCALVHRDQLWCWGIAPHLPWVDGAGSGTPVRVPIDI